jgi:hypothetical protein
VFCLDPDTAAIVPAVPHAPIERIGFLLKNCLPVHRAPFPTVPISPGIALAAPTPPLPTAFARGAERPNIFWETVRFFHFSVALIPEGFLMKPLANRPVFATPVANLRPPLLPNTLVPPLRAILAAAAQKASFSNSDIVSDILEKAILSIASFKLVNVNFSA